MTVRRTLTLGIGEIKALELRCRQCHGAVSLPLGYSIAEFIRCPGCGETLIDHGDRHAAIFKLMASLVQWGRFQELPLDLIFTVDLPSEVR